MSEQKKQMRSLSANDKEIELLKSVFADNEPFLKSVRALFLGFPINGNEATLITAVFKNKEVKEAFRKKFYPKISPDSEIGTLSDFWFGTEAEVIDKSPETINQVVASKELTLVYLEQAFGLLDDPAGKPVDYSFDPTGKSDPFQVRLLARNKFVKSIETALTIIKVIAGTKAETVEEAKKRLDKDSNK